jgi:hypothetical protein
MGIVVSLSGPSKRIVVEALARPAASPPAALPTPGVTPAPAPPEPKAEPAQRP